VPADRFPQSFLNLCHPVLQALASSVGQSTLSRIDYGTAFAPLVRTRRAVLAFGILGRRHSD